MLVKRNELDVNHGLACNEPFLFRYTCQIKA